MVSVFSGAAVTSFCTKHSLATTAEWSLTFWVARLNRALGKSVFNTNAAMSHDSGTDSIISLRLQRSESPPRTTLAAAPIA